MGFHSVVTGYVISRDVADFLTIICKSVIINGKKYTKENFEDIDLMEMELTDPIYSENEISWELYEDIEMERGMVYYRKDHNIKIGTPQCCICMIYLFCVGEDMGGSDCDEYVPEKSVLNLIRWKIQLGKEDRLDKNTKFGSVMNCC